MEKRKREEKGKEEGREIRGSGDEEGGRGGERMKAAASEESARYYLYGWTYIGAH